MAQINEALFTLLGESTRLDYHKNQTEVFAALNAILDAGYKADTPDTAKVFRQAVSDKKSFWNPLLNGLDHLNEQAIQDNEDLTNDSFLDHNEFSQFTQLTTLKIAKLSLKKANESQLQEIITQSIDGQENQKTFRKKFFNDNNGESIFVGSSLQIKNWATEQVNLLPTHFLDNLKLAAQQELLIRKININKDLTKLNNLLASTTENEFNTAVRGLFGNANGANEIRAAVFPQVRSAAAKKALSLLIEDKNLLADEVVLASSPHILNELNSNTFRNNLKRLGGLANLSADALNDTPPEAYMNEIKGSLGARFIALKASELNAGEIPFIENIASSSELEITKSQLNKHAQFRGVDPDSYTNYAVTSTSLPNIRQAFATQALKLQIAQSVDPAALDALMTATNISTLQKVLSEQESLGFKDKPKFKEAFTATTDFNSLIAIAHIRKNLSFSDKKQQLKNLIISNDFVGSYHANFSRGIKQDTQTAINAYFSNPHNVTSSHEQALITFAKLELAQQNNDVTLMSFINAESDEDLSASTERLLSSNAANSLIAGKPIDSGVSKELRKIAAIEKIIFDAKVTNQNLSKATGNIAYNALIANINSFTFDPPTNANVKRLVSAPDFSSKEKQRIEANLVESLIRNYPLDRIPLQQPPARDKLTELAKATDIADFTKKLNDNFAVGNTSWANDSTMEQVQKTACIRLVELNQNNALKFTSAEHPLASRAHSKLIQLISHLPLAKQQALLDNSVALSALAGVENRFAANSPEGRSKSIENQAEIERILGNKNLVPENLIKAAVSESENLNRISKIANAKIITRLAQMDPTVTLTTANVEAINQLLISNPYRQLESNNTQNYQAVIQEIARNRDANVQNSIYQAFGLENGGIVNQGTINYILIQHTENEHLITYYNKGTTSPADKIILSHLMSLDKGNVVTVPHITNLLADIKNSKTLEEFIKLMKKPPQRNYISGANPPFEPPLEQQLTPQMYERLKIESRQKTFANPDTYLAELKTQQEELDKLEEKFSETQLGFFDSRKLERLTKITPLYWFNPAFHAFAKKHASQLGEELKEFFSAL